MNLSLISSKRITLFKSIGFIFLASLFLSFAGCSTHRDFTYEPQSIEEAPQSVLKIAVMPFQENRKTRSDGSLDIANLPFVPSASKVEDAPQEITVRESGEYYYPDLLAYALTLDLIHNKVGSIVHLDPVVTEHYDIVIRGTLDGVPLTTERLSYGLGAASGVLRIVGVPSGSNTLEVIATYDMSEPGKTPSLYREQLKGEYSQTQWNGTEKIWGQQDNPVVLPGNAAPYIHGLLEAFHDITEEFITKSASQVEQLAAGLSDRESRFRYYRSLDPTLVRLESAIQRSSGSRKSNYLTEYKRRLVFLE
ncbi:MAG: hypothetical protein KDD70_15835, partial [Bdellovibrionales bacterium]|nr:hypothetical protein [Bdellovibrionales bacterium]